MDTQDKDIKKLFDGFNPSLNDTDKFLRRLENSMDGVEFIRQSQKNTLRHYRRAAVISGIFGFLCGCVMMLLLPWISSLFNNIPAISDFSDIIAWVIAVGVTVGVCFTSFLMSVQPGREY
ncbi:MAG: hypothetical protein HDS99_04670 [Bacteroidales bacterium]|nr:hypothetical protein [Bacteroidales bacterium]